MERSEEQRREALDLARTEMRAYVEEQRQVKNVCSAALDLSVPHVKR